MTNKNIKWTGDKINIKHYAEWMRARKKEKRRRYVGCNCLLPGHPSTMCCGHYYAEEFDPLEWSPNTFLLNSWYPINAKKYRKLRKENTIFLTFILLLTTVNYSTIKLLKLVYGDDSSMGEMSDW